MSKSHDQSDFALDFKLKLVLQSVQAMNINKDMKPGVLVLINFILQGQDGGH